MEFHFIENGLYYQRVINKNPPLMSATCHFWVISESDLRVKNKHHLKFKNKRHTKNSSAPKAREKIGFWGSCKAETDEKISAT